LKETLKETPRDDGGFELDESYFGAKRVRGKRGRGAAEYRVRYEAYICWGQKHCAFCAIDPYSKEAVMHTASSPSSGNAKTLIRRGIGGLIKTGPAGRNVNDITVILSGYVLGRRSRKAGGCLFPVSLPPPGKAGR
jgi:hypothetical protein